MKLVGKDVSVNTVLAYLEERLEARGLRPPPDSSEAPLDGVEPRVDPLAFNLDKLTEHADSTLGLPVESHRGGLQGRALVLAKRLFRVAGQALINETLARQRLFNGHVRDSYAQLSAEVMRLRTRVAELEAEKAAALTAPASAPGAARGRRRPPGSGGAPGSR
jgi:hypothetical protein